MYYYGSPSLCQGIATVTSSQARTEKIKGGPGPDSSVNPELILKHLQNLTLWRYLFRGLKLEENAQAKKASERTVRTTSRPQM